ncbi:MAG: delta(1)-pyrroline-2-carboxylate reductase family protein [Burkholderiaceae bacterium]
MTLRQLDAARTAAALPWPALAEALRRMLRRRVDGSAHAPDRLALPLPGGVLLVMPASDGEFAATKLATLHDGNPARGLPNLRGEILLMRADDGERLLLLDGPTLTARRTAALSALAALELAPPRRDRLLIIGAGPQARAHLDAFSELLAPRRIRIAARTPANAEALAAEARSRGLDCSAVAAPNAAASGFTASDMAASKGGASSTAAADALADALADSDLVVTATNSTQPLFDDEARFSGFIAAVGAFKPQMCELPAALLQRAAVFVDDLPGARHEAGDLLQAGIDWRRVRSLEQHLFGTEAGTKAEAAAATAAGLETGSAAAAGTTANTGPIVFKSVGHALWDLAASRLAWEEVRDSRRTGAAVPPRRE